MIDTSSLDKVGEYIEQLEEGGKQARKRVIELVDEKNKLAEENKKLKEFKTKREESMFYFKALAERVEPINSKEAEELQKYKKLFEKLYREELYYLEEENRKLREELSAYDREYFDEDKKAKNIFMEEDTLQELKDIGKI